MLAIAYAVTGGAYDFYAFDAAGLVYNGSAWVAWADVDFADYRIPAVESGASGRFIATLPDDTARYAMRASGVDLAGSYLVWEEVVGGGGGSLTPEQATWIEETHAKAMLIGTGGAFVEVINPVGPGGKITLYSGYDYTSATTPISLPGATVDDDTAVTLHAVPDRYGDEGEAIDLTGTVAGGEYVLEATRDQIPASRAGQYRYQVWADDGGDHALLAAGTLVIARGK